MTKYKVAIADYWDKHGIDGGFEMGLFDTYDEAETLVNALIDMNYTELVLGKKIGIDIYKVNTDSDDVNYIIANCKKAVEKAKTDLENKSKLTQLVNNELENNFLECMLGLSRR